MVQDRPTVLIVDDEPAVADGHAAQLDGRYDVRTAYTGEEALQKLDETVTVALLDRRMPTLSGDQVLTEIRERDLPCRVAMVTAVEPTLDIVDLGFDGYLQKPVSRPELFETVETLSRRAEYDVKLQEFFSLASRVAVLRTEYDEAALTENQEFQELTNRIDRLRADLEDTLSDLPPEEGYAVATQGNAPFGDSFTV